MNSKKINELENYVIENASDGDFIPVVEVASENALKKASVLALRDEFAKYNMANVSTLFESLLEALTSSGTLAANAAERMVGAVLSKVESWSVSDFRGWLRELVNSLESEALIKPVAGFAGVEYDEDDSIETIRSAVIDSINDDGNWGGERSALGRLFSPLKELIWGAIKAAAAQQAQE